MPADVAGFFVGKVLKSNALKGVSNKIKKPAGQRAGF
jgi:hypothetical protein